MLLNTEVSLALKNYLGQYDIKDITLFEMNKVKDNFPSTDIKLYKGREISIKLRCPLCGEIHNYNYTIGELFKRDMVVGGCELMGMPLFFMGNKDNVYQRIGKMNEINKKLCAMM